MSKGKATPGTKQGKRNAIFDTIHLNVAGVDAGRKEHWVAVPADRDAEPVRKFATTTRGLYELADWLEQCRIERVAVEATGVYCVPLLAVLEDRGLEVNLVKPSSLKAVNEYQKSDLLDCQWIQTLETFGLLRASFRPSAQISELRVYMWAYPGFVDRLVIGSGGGSLIPFELQG